MAKGVEDTAYYRWSRFVAANEVGGDPARLGGTVAQFHEAQARRSERRPESMTTLSTHDTKRSEDVRARLAVLAEVPSEWARLVRGWLARHPLDDRPLAHLVWQNLVGAWPLSRERAHAYAEKAAREAGTSTTWTAPDAAFEERLHALVDAAFDDPATAAEIDAFVTRIAPFGWSNSLAQKLLQLTMPGVPDVYQGTELWDFSLVDPDNRRPVDYALRRKLLASLDRGQVPPVDETGTAKLLVVSRILRARRDHPEWFAGYAPVAVTGSAADHVVAFDRGAAVTVATRLPVRLAGAGWGDTALQLPTGAWRDLLSGERVVSDVAGAPVDALLVRLPVALLVRD
jgi:(1->4)-alpha-D-glucan 1-alpha-D-glucosylmutase